MELGCLFECHRNKHELPILADGTRLRHLLNDDTLTLQAWCGGEDPASCALGFGEFSGTIIAAENIL